MFVKGSNRVGMFCGEMWETVWMFWDGRVGGGWDGREVEGGFGTGRSGVGRT